MYELNIINYHGRVLERWKMAIYVKDLEIDLYRGIKNLELNNLSDINILTGDNNSGKTSILEILRASSYPMEIESWNSSLRTPETIFFSNELSFFENILLLFNINENFIKYRFITNSNEKIEMYITCEEEVVELEEKEIDKISGIVFKNKKNDLEKLIPMKKLKLMFYKNNELVNEKEIYEVSRRRIIKNKIENEFFTSIYISPFQHIEGTLYLNNIIDNPELYQEMIEILKEFDKDIISINASKGGRSIVYKILSQSGSIPLNVYGDGMKKAILLISAVVKAKNGVLLLDEFETAIHTTAMKEVFSWILRSCIKLNVQLFLTSHSKEAIEKVLNCCPELQEKINLYTLYKKENQTVARRLTAKEAIEASESFNLELR